MITTIECPICFEFVLSGDFNANAFCCKICVQEIQLRDELEINEEEDRLFALREDAWEARFDLMREEG